MQRARFVPVLETGDGDAEAGSLDRSEMGKPTTDSGAGMHVNVKALHAEGQQGSSRVDSNRRPVQNITRGRAD